MPLHDGMNFVAQTTTSSARVLNGADTHFHSAFLSMGAHREAATTAVSLFFHEETENLNERVRCESYFLIATRGSGPIVVP